MRVARGQDRDDGGGVIKSDHVRAPLQPMSQRTKERLLQLSRELDVIALKWGK